LKRFYEQVKARRGAGKAIIALAKKYLGIIYRRVYKDLCKRSLHLKEENVWKSKKKFWTN
jgi:hypothetical protein